MKHYSHKVHKLADRYAKFTNCGLPTNESIIQRSFLSNGNLRITSCVFCLGGIKNEVVSEKGVQKLKPNLKKDRRKPLDTKPIVKPSTEDDITKLSIGKKKTEKIVNNSSKNQTVTLPKTDPDIPSYQKVLLKTSNEGKISKSEITITSPYGTEIKLPIGKMNRRNI